MKQEAVARGGLSGAGRCAGFGRGSILGQVVELLPYGLRILAYCALDALTDEFRDMDAHCFYVAPLDEVTPAVMDKLRQWPYVSPARPGFRAQGCHIHVKFQAAGASSDCAGQYRARDVELSHCEKEGGVPQLSPRIGAETQPTLTQPAWRTPPASDDLCIQTIAKLPPRALLPLARLPQLMPPTVTQQARRGKERTTAKTFRLTAIFRSMHILRKVVHEWQRLDTGDRASEAIEVLEEESRAAQAASDPDRIADVLLRAVGGLAPPGACLGGEDDGAEPASFTEGDALATGAEFRGKRPLQARERSDLPRSRAAQDQRLRSITLSCLSALDYASATSQACIPPVLEHLTSLMKSGRVDPNAQYSGRLQWAKIGKSVAEASQALTVTRLKDYERLREQWRCCVPGCLLLGVSRTKRDKDSAAGYYCTLHMTDQWPTFCSVPGCGRPKSRRVTLADEWGSSGFRCKFHGRYRCTATGCDVMNAEKHRALEDDEFGPAGFRCSKHLSASVPLCAVPDCGLPAFRQLLKSAVYSVREWRCQQHYIRRCEEPGCRRSTHHKDASHCHRHGGERCSVPNCNQAPHTRQGLKWVCDSHGTRRRWAAKRVLALGL